MLYKKEIKVFTKEEVEGIYLQKFLVLEGLVLNFVMCCMLFRQNTKVVVKHRFKRI